MTRQRSKSIRMHGPSKWIVGIAGLAVIAGTIVAGPPAVGAGLADLRPAPSDVRAVPVRVVQPKSAQSSRVPIGKPVIPVVWPSGVAVIRLSASGTSSAAGLPVSLGRGIPAESSLKVAGQRSVAVSVSDQSVAQAAGVRGIIVSLESVSGGGSTAVALDYSGFKDAFGGDWTSRLALVQLPGCALTSPGIASCQTRTAIRSTNDLRRHLVTAQVLLPSAGTKVSAAPLLLALTSVASGSAGSFSATPLAAAGSWSAGGSSGDFTYSVPVAVPGSIGGDSPSISLGYDSGSVDGRMASTNNQGSWVGDGWDYQPGFIERSYIPCKDAPGASAAAKASAEQCWAGQILSMSLGGHSGAMVLDDQTGLWHLTSDNGEKLERLTGAVNGVWGGEHWRLTSTEGTQYYFGLNHLPGWASINATTNSAWPTRVYAATSSDNCYSATSFASSFCAAAWRWNLDYVVDTNGNATSYTYATEAGAYKPTGATTATATYVRAGHVSRIDYGMRSDSIYSKPAPAQVTLTTANRCFTAACATHTAANWPDTPWDQDCAVGAVCAVTSPTFWTTLRLASVATQVLRNSGTLPALYSTGDTYALGQSFLDPGDGTSQQLWLNSFQHTGADGTTIAMPPTTFAPKQLANRIDTTSSWPAMVHSRIDSISTGSGGIVRVTYSDPECTPTQLPTTLDGNTLRCYPAYWTPPLLTAPVQNWFNKYVVTAVSEDDTAAAGPSKVTRYTYLGGGAWHYDDNEVVKPAFRTYGQWRGYAQVQTRTGDLGDLLTRSDNWFYRGMNGDKLPNSGARVVMVSGPPGSPTNIPDANEFSGMGRHSLTYLGDTTTVVNESVTDEGSRLTATRARAASGLAAQTATMVHVNTVTNTSAAPQLAGAKRTTTAAYTYNDSGLVTQTDESGDIASTGDERCTRNTYAATTGLYIMNLPQEIEVDGASCAAAAAAGFDKALGVVSNERTIYDFHAFGAPVTNGTPTSALKATGWTLAGGFTYLNHAVITTDVYGRTIKTVDPITGASTATTYSPALFQRPTQVLVTSTFLDAVGATQTQVTTTTLGLVRGLPTRVLDANARITDETYDSLGRLTAVWTPGRDKATYPTSPNTKFAYTTSNTAPASVTTRTLLESEAYRTTVTLFDGLLRPRQVQSEAANNATQRVISDTLYDTHGWVVRTNNHYYDPSGPPNGTLVAPASNSAVDDQTRTSFDGVGRPLIVASYFQNTESWRTTSAYAGDRVTTMPPTGGTPTRVISDAFGRTIELDQYTDAAATTFQATKYTFDNLGRAKTTKSGGRTWTSTFDFQGRLIQQIDPDAGTSTMGYDDADRLVLSTDSLGQTLSYRYDGLGRKIAAYNGDIATNASAPKLSSWTFDTLKKGLISSSTRYVGTDAYTTAVTGYDVRLAPSGSKITIPAVEGALAGTYQVDHLYTPNIGLPLQDNYPAVAGLPAENVRFGYDNLSNLSSTNGLNNYVASTQYTVLGEIAQVSLGFGSNSGQLTYAYDAHSRRLLTQTVDRRTVPTRIDQMAYTYDAAGNISNATDTRAAIGTVDTQCFGYDTLRRLTGAWTATDNCAGAPTVGGASPTVGGPDAYWSNWTYDLVGNRKSETKHSTVAGTADTVGTYTYNGAGSGQPDSLTKVATTGPSGPTTSTFTYDAAGQVGVRSVVGGVQSFSFDVEHHLGVVSGPGGSSSFVRDADGDVLVRRQPGLVTLSVFGMELGLSSGTGVVVGTRYYQHRGAPVGVRSGSVFSFLVADPHGSAGLSLDGSAQVASFRSFTPFGGVRGVRGVWPDQHDFLGLAVDSAQGLSLLGARQYDSGLGRFLSVDPVLDTSDPQSLSGYGYANGNPVGGSDPSGLMLQETYSGGGCSGSCAKKVVAQEAKHPQKKTVWPPPLDESGMQKQMAADAAARDAAAQAAQDRPWWEAVLPIVASIAVAVVVAVAVAGVCATGVGCVLLAGAVAGAAGSAAQYGAEVVEGVHSFDVGDFAKTVGFGAVSGALGAGAGALAGKAAGAIISRVGAPVKAFASRVGARLGAGNGESYLYRGVAAHHPGYEDALRGIARPRGGSATALEHNLGNTSSELTSWSTDLGVAESFAGGGATLRVPLSSVLRQVVSSPDKFRESEVLLRGDVIGAEIR